jgi:integrase
MASWADRQKLAPRGRPYPGRLIAKGVQLCCRRLAGLSCSTWLVSYPSGKAKGARVAHYKLPIPADDHGKVADGALYVSEDQAFARAFDWWRSRALVKAGIPDERYTFAQLLADHIADRRADGVGMNSVEGIYKKWIAAFGDLPFNHLDKKWLKDQHRAIRNSAPVAATHIEGVGPRPRAGFDPNNDEHRRRRAVSANKELLAIKSAFNWARGEGGKIAGERWWDEVRPFPDVNQPRGRVLTDAEIERFFRAADRLQLPELIIFVLVCRMCGTRVSEAMALQRQDWDSAAGILYVTRSKKRQGGKDSGLKGPKTKSGKRGVPMTSQGAQILDAVFAQGAARPATDWLMLSPDGVQWNYGQLYRMLGRACREAKLDVRINTHDLRRTFGTAWARSGLNPWTLAKILGHADLDSLGWYVNIGEMAAREDVRAIDPSVGFEVPQISNAEMLEGARRRRPSPVTRLRAIKK